MDRVIDFLGIKVNALTTDEVVEKILEFAIFGKHRMITYLNAHCVNVSFVDEEYRKILLQTDILYPDGRIIGWVSRFLKVPLSGRIDAMELLGKVVEEATRKSISFYLLGGALGVTQRVTDNMQERIPNLKILGSHHGYFDEREEGKIVEEINLLKPHILLVGMGVPKQEKWIYRNLDKLNVNLCWAVGGVFDNLSGFLARAPRWMSESGWEWLYRLLQEPKRLWRRYLIGNFIFVYRILRWKIRGLFSQ